MKLLSTMFKVKYDSAKEKNKLMIKLKYTKIGKKIIIDNITFVRIDTNRFVREHSVGIGETCGGCMVCYYDVSEVTMLVDDYIRCNESKNNKHYFFS